MENFNRDNSDIFSIEVDDSSKTTFLEMARWTKFLAILGFIFLGLVVVGGIFLGLAVGSMGSTGQFGALAGFGSAGIILLYLLLAGIMFYPAYGLLKYSTGIKTAINTNNKQKFNEAITYLKNVFKYYGVISIIFLGLYGLVIIIVALGAIGR